MRPSHSTSGYVQRMITMALAGALVVATLLVIAWLVPLLGLILALVACGVGIGLTVPRERDDGRRPPTG